MPPVAPPIASTSPPSVVRSGVSAALRPLGRWVGGGARTLGGLLLLGVWLLAGALAFRLPPAGAAAALSLISLLFLELHGRRGLGLRRTVEPGFLSLRRLRSRLPLLALLLPPLFLLDAVFSLLYGRLVAPPTEAGALERYAALPGGALPVALFVILLAPLAEEFAFRGWIQMELARRWNPVAAVLVSSLLFAVAHGELERVGYFAVYGGVYGYVVLRTRSLLCGVFLHAGMNACIYAAQTVSAPGGAGAGSGLLLALGALWLAAAAARVRTAWRSPSRRWARSATRTAPVHRCRTERAVAS